MTISEYLRNNLTAQRIAGNIDSVEFVAFQADEGYDCDTCGGQEMFCQIEYQYINNKGDFNTGWYHLSGTEIVAFLNQITE